jgi:hypothetical protein
MRKQVIGVFLAAGLALSALAGPVLGDQEATVDICHWRGHKLEMLFDEVISDVYVSGPPDDPYEEPLQVLMASLCVELGGKVLTVSQDEAVSDHGVVDLFNG